MTTQACALCGNKPADHGLMCAICRAADTAMREGCDCAVCRSDPGRAGIVPCMIEEVQ